MAKNIERITNFQHFLPLFLSQDLERQYQFFCRSPLGQIYQAIPWKILVKTFKLKESKKGPTSIFPPRGKIALMFLKAYSQTSDKRLIEQLNANIYYQFFCGIRFLAGQELKNHKIVSKIRCELAESLDSKKIQTILMEYWKPYIREKSKITIDATCYESDVRYPTDQKLLWESVCFLYEIVKKQSKRRGIRLIRTKYKKWAKRYAIYARMRRKSKKEKIALTRAVINLIKKLDHVLDGIEEHFTPENEKLYQKQRAVIKKVLAQQHQILLEGEPPKNRIISLFKPYLRPIVRGKEVKKVEFGAKVNKIQIDGINFIEHCSFEAFNEGTRFQASIHAVQELTGIKIRKVGADAIYATNANRKFATSEGIRTDFVRKGRAGKNEEERKQIAKALRKERTSFLEGSFGNEKEHYNLKKVKARTEKTELLWIFFGIHTANAVKIGGRMAVARSVARLAG